MLEKDLNIKSTNKQRRKLVDYLNEYEEELSGEKGHFTYTSRFDEVHIISKKFGFIQWLVDNYKIDISKLGKESDMGFGDKYERDESLLMLLSISETPIEDLISYLK